MNTNDMEIASKIGAKDLISELHGLNILTADRHLTLLAHSYNCPCVYAPHDIEVYRARLNGLPKEVALDAIRLARHIILAHTEVDMNSEAATLVFNLWSKEAALAGARMAA